MKLDILRAIIGKRFEFFYRAYRVSVPAGTFPYIKRSSPISVTGNTPVLNIFDPLSESSGTNCFRNPIHFIIILYKLVSDRRHFDKPSVSGIIDKRSVTTPAIGIRMFEIERSEQKPSVRKRTENLLVSVFAKHTRPIGLGRHLSFCVYKLQKRKIIISSDSRVVLAERRRYMDNSGTVGKSDITVASDKISFFIKFREIKKRKILFILELFTVILLNNGIIIVLYNGGNKRLRENIPLPAAFYFYINLFRIYAKRDI